MKQTTNGPDFEWKHKLVLLPQEINFLFDQAELQSTINIYLDDHIHNKHFPDFLLQVLKRNAEYKTHFQIQSNSGVIILSCQKRNPNGNDQPHQAIPNEKQVEEILQQFFQPTLTDPNESPKVVNQLPNDLHPFHQKHQNDHPIPFDDQLKGQDQP
jgi:hypothetical protein